MAAVDRREIELSQAAYDEIQTKLIEAGYDFMCWPGTPPIAMDGFRVWRQPDAHAKHPIQAVEDVI